MGVLGLTMATPPPVRNVFASYNVYDDVVDPSYPVEDEEEHTVADPCAGLAAAIGSSSMLREARPRLRRPKTRKGRSLRSGPSGILARGAGRISSGCP